MGNSHLEHWRSRLLKGAAGGLTLSLSLSESRAANMAVGISQRKLPQQTEQERIQCRDLHNYEVYHSRSARGLHGTILILRLYGTMILVILKAPTALQHNTV